MITLIAPRVWSQITIAAKKCKKPAHIAVAYFGANGDKLLPVPKGSSIVVDASLSTLAAGATCPTALERLRKVGVSIYSAQHLHAKVYAFDHAAFIGSANASDYSKRTLIEAVLRVDNKSMIAAARAFVTSICLTQLSARDLAELASHYRRPKFRALTPKPEQIKYSTLLMELTYEQGAGRATQVQPPKAVWEHYFGINVGRETLPMMTLINESGRHALETRRKVVEHDHNYTIEIAGAELPRPAILQMRRLGKHIYSYRIHRPGDERFPKMEELLETMPNPLRSSGRLWILL